MNTRFRIVLLLVVTSSLVASHSLTSPTEPLPRTPNNPVLAPPLTGWNIDIVDILESGRCIAVEKRGDLVYASFEATLSVFDISAPSSPAKIGHTLLSSQCWGMERSGDYLYCMLPVAKSMEIVDVSDPTSPQIVGSVPADGSAIAIEGNYLYLEDSDTIRVLDISTPTIPMEVGSVIAGLTTDIVAQDGYVYATDFIRGLRIIDATDPANPTEVALVSIGDGAYGVDISGTYAYVVPGLCIVDVSDPQSPAIISNVPGSYGDVTVEGSYAYLSNNQESLDVFDVTDAADPVLAASCASCDVYWFSHVRELAVSGGIAVVAGVEGAMCIIDVSNPLAPIFLSSYKSLLSIDSVDIANGYLALSSRYRGFGGLLTVNRYDTDQRYWTYASPGRVNSTKVVVKGDYAYVGNCDSYAQTASGIAVVDVSDPTDPDEIGFLPVSTCVENLAVGSSHVYYTDWNGIVVADVSDPANPTAVGELHNVTYGVSGLFADEPYLYVANAENCLKVVDVSDPTTPTFVGSGFSFNGDARGVWVSDGYAYVTGIDYDHEIGLWILDVTNPLSPSLVGTFATNSETDHVRVRDSYLYLQSAGLFQILDVTNPATPIEVGHIAIDLQSQIAIVPPYIYSGSGPLLKLQTKLVTAVAEGVPPMQGLMQNHPNPFSSSTTIEFAVEHNGVVELSVFDVQGKRVATLFRGSLPAGPRSVTWDGRNELGEIVSSGIYFCILRSLDSMDVKKIVVLR